jgi:hypothetical protein
MIDLCTAGYAFQKSAPITGSTTDIFQETEKDCSPFTKTGQKEIVINGTCNQPPTADAGGPYLVAVGGQVTLNGSGSSDPDGDSLTAEWTADGGVVAGNIYTAGNVPGVYDVTLIVNDGTVDSELATTMVVVYDPNGGFVTGGGWINSPAGAYVGDPVLSGKANFGFVSKYQKGATVPSGNTEFQFHAGNLNFHSSTYEWLVVAGARAQFKGSGTINNAGNYGFLLTAIDGQVSGGGGADKFRIKIWNKSNGDATVYDNQLGATDGSDPTTTLGGGSIVIHTTGKK